MAINQAYLFLIFTLNGILIGVLFDIFRILRKTFKTTNLITYLEDILFWILTGISIIFFMYNFSDGNLRLFMFFGLSFGIILYMLTLSKFIIKFFISIITIIKNILKKIIKIIIKPLKIIYNTLNKILFKQIYFLYKKIYSFLTKTIQKNKYKLKKLKKLGKM